MAASRDGRTIASGGWDSKVIVWDIRTGAALRQCHVRISTLPLRRAQSSNLIRLRAGSREEYYLSEHIAQRRDRDFRWCRQACHRVEPAFWQATLQLRGLTSFLLNCLLSSGWYLGVLCNDLCDYLVVCAEPQ